MNVACHTGSKASALSGSISFTQLYELCADMCKLRRLQYRRPRLCSGRSSWMRQGHAVPTAQEGTLPMPPCHWRYAKSGSGRGNSIRQGGNSLSPLLALLVLDTPLLVSPLWDAGSPVFQELSCCISSQEPLLCNKCNTAFPELVEGGCVCLRSKHRRNHSLRLFKPADQSHLGGKPHPLCGDGHCPSVVTCTTIEPA